MPNPRYRRRISPDNAAKGAAAEERFQAWLNDSRLPFVYCTQDVASVPAHFKGALKRPDYFVALPFVGTIAFDVKAKSLYEGCFIFDQDEIEKLIHFDEIFRLTTYFACLDPDDPGRCWWFRVGRLARMPTQRRMGVQTMAVSVQEGLQVRMDEPLQYALRDVLLLV
jgi:Holliday junction resolvase